MENMKANYTFQISGVLKQEECLETATKVNELRDYWIQRDQFGLYTLGAAAYLDAPDQKTMKYFGQPEIDPIQYYEKAKKLNQILTENFGWLYHKLSIVLSEQLESNVRLYPNVGCPGFHIFLPSPEYAFSTSHIPHFDRQFTNLNWNEAREIDFKSSISFTLAIQLPRSGGGLRIWSVDYYQIIDLPKEEAKELVRSKKSKTCLYQLGGLICHNGNHLHQIMPWQAQSNDDQRITMQGHGLFFDGFWNLYW